jgi:hypothetical protein
MLVPRKSYADFSRGCACRKIGIHLSRPTPYPVIRRWFYVSPACLRILAAANLHSPLSKILCPAISRRAENNHYPRTGVGLCRMLDMDFGEFTFLRPWVNKGAQGPEGSPPSEATKVPHTSARLHGGTHTLLGASRGTESNGPDDRR